MRSPIKPWRGSKMAAASSRLGELFHEELTCSICLELFTRPKVLPCQHTLCEDCLQDLMIAKKYRRCPNCRRQVRLPGKGVAGLPDNLMAANMCEGLRNQATLSGETTEQPQSGNRCSFHPSEEVTLYCKQCSVPVCNECLDVHHSDHETISLKKASRERKALVEVLITEGRNISEAYFAFLKSLREKEKSLDEQKQEAVNSIIQAYHQFQRGDLKRDYVLFVDGLKYKRKKEAIQEERDRLQADVDELSAACDRAEQELQHVWTNFLFQETILAELVEKHRGKLQKAALEQRQLVAALFQPPDTQVLPMVTVAAILLVAIGVLLYSQLTFQPHPKTIPFGGEGSGTGQLHFPVGVAVSDQGEIFVADRGNQRIQVFTLQGTFVRQFPTVTLCNEKMTPDDVALDGEGNLWVVGTHLKFSNFAVQYNKQGRVLRKFNLQKTGFARGVAVDTRRNHILITQTTGVWDNRHGEVLVFRPDGTLVRTVGRKQGMNHPWYITVDGEGNILVSDSRNNCVYVYNEDGQFLFQFGDEVTQGSGDGQLFYPRGICTDSAGNIIVADWGNSRVEMFDKTGRFIKHIATDTSLLIKVVLNLKSRDPWGVAIGPQGQLVMTVVSENATHIIPSY
ncbi:tripartite motif-containing protein 3-like [Branchiostoma floridae]|uniref:RING-type E3 ubiquitin transferase n=2 Tax=Branchiostoma floridae TaxID=7739 RepID=A0A9J7MDF2_BRAFL|nr:tripartite motif-containing protein 3-like [Branchiostoma floridae]